MTDYARAIDAADRLIASAADSIRSFYSRAANRFLRDSIDTGDKCFTTGGGAVTADLWGLEGELTYLARVLPGKPFRELNAHRNAASEWVKDPSNEIEFSSVFGSLNAYRVAAAAHQVGRADAASARAIVFGAELLDGYRGEWPILGGDQDQEAHPYVAHRLLNAAEAIVGTGVQAAIASCDPNQIVQTARVPCAAEFKAAVTGVLEHPPNLDSTRQEFTALARDYLWRQHGFSAPGSSAPNWLRYDPVGTCFALSMLVEAPKKVSGAEERTRHLTLHEDLVQLSVTHVLSAITPTGVLPYGLPFSYSEKGMGAFATSISGLAALAQVLTTVFVDSRRSFYSNATFLDELLESSAEPFDRLFDLPVAIERAKQSVRGSTGWSTDRAPSLQRIESWVSMDVLRFAVYLRLLVQEVAQFHVVRKYRAVEVVGLPTWSYPPDKDMPLVADDVMHDPDQSGDGAGEDARRRLAPIPLLHERVRKPMAKETQAWHCDTSAVLLFGPPGTSKSTLVKSLAQALGWHFLELTPSNFVEEGLEMIERRSREIFEDLGMLRETVVLFDELDSLLIDREQLEASSILNFTVPALLPKLQKLTKTAKDQRVLVVFATNFYDRLDAAMSRRGRIDERLVVLPPNEPARRATLGGPPSGDELEGDKLDTGVIATRLAVHEDLVRYLREIKKPGRVAEPISGITPALYFSRLPRVDEEVKSIRATVRLGIEVAEVVGRLLDKPRALSADARAGAIVKRLDELARELRGDGDYDDWRTLCESLKYALSPRDLVAQPEAGAGAPSS